MIYLLGNCDRLANGSDSARDCSNLDLFPSTIVSRSSDPRKTSEAYNLEAKLGVL